MESRPSSEITECSYSGRGDLICAALNSGMERNYTYSAAGELLTVTSTGTVTTTLQEDLYDANGTRIRRTEADGDHDYYYANGALALIEGPSTDIAFLLAEDAPYGMVQGNDTYQYLTDLQGSVMAAMSGSSAAAVYSYTDFGETVEQLLESGFTNELCYTGAVYDRVTSLYYLNARYYDPATANFLSQDTYRGEKGDYEQWNLYAYCANDPINYYDSSGHYRLRRDIVMWIVDIALAFAPAAKTYDLVGWVLKRYYEKKGIAIAASIYFKFEGVVPKVIGAFSKFFYVIRYAIWKTTHFWIQWFVQTFAQNILYNVYWFTIGPMRRYARDIIECLFTTGGVISLGLDLFSDWRLDGYIWI